LPKTTLPKRRQNERKPTRTKFSRGGGMSLSVHCSSGTRTCEKTAPENRWLQHTGFLPLNCNRSWYPNRKFQTPKAEFAGAGGRHITFSFHWIRATRCTWPSQSCRRSTLSTTVKKETANIRLTPIKMTSRLTSVRWSECFVLTKR